MTYVFSGVGLDVGADVTGSDCYSGSGTTRDAAVACAGQAGGKAAAAACLATPGLELAAPLCSEAGQWIAENLAGPIYDGAVEVFEGIFGGPKGASPTQANASGAWHVWDARMLYSSLATQLVRTYNKKVKPAVEQAGGVADSMESWRAEALLDTFGAKKLVADQIASGKPYGLYPAAGIKCWFLGKDWWLPYHEFGNMNNAGCGFMLADPLADAWAQSMAPAYGKALSWMTTDAAKQVAKAKVKQQLVKTSFQELTAPGKTWPWLAGAAALLGGGAWWLHRRRRRR